MEVKRKISIRKILQVLLTVTVAAGCIVAMVSASTIEGELPLKSLPVIHISNDRKYHFIEQKEIMDLAIYNRNIDILHTPVSRLDAYGIEQAIMKDPWVADAQVFIDIDRMMHIYVTQRVPVARIFRKDGTSYYMDSTLHTMPLSDNYTYYTMVVTNAPDMKNDSAGLGLRKQIATLLKTINVDSFWSAQVSQVVIDSVGMFELIPVLGNQRILFGDTSAMKDKFSNLLTFYKNVLNRIGWDKYETLDLRFRNQVVAAPSLPYKGPVDKAIAKMNWITSIEVTEAQKRLEDSLRIATIKVVGVTAKSEAILGKSLQAGSTKAKAAAKATAKTGGAKEGTLQSKPNIKDVTAKKELKSVITTPSKAAASANKKADVQKKPVLSGKEGTNKGKLVKDNTDDKLTGNKQNTTKKTDLKDKAGKKPNIVAGTKKAIIKNTAKLKNTIKSKPGKKDDKKKNKEKGKVKDKKSEKQKTTVSPKYTYPENKGH
jgi:cell division protein FtsQ